MHHHHVLFEPITVGSMKLKNRLAMAPMGTLQSTHDGYVTDQLTAYYNARAKGGVGLVIVEHTLVTDKYGGGLLGLWNDRQITGHNDLVESAASRGAKIVVQLSAGMGRQGAARWIGVQPVAPSAVPYYGAEETLTGKMKKKGGLQGDMPRSLDMEEIEELEDLFAESAFRARTAGYHGIEIHAAHGYLIYGFLSPNSNKRHDRYGGTLNGRMRLLNNIIEKTRKKTGNDFVVGIRISADEHVAGGLGLAEMENMVAVISANGLLDYIHVSSGTGESYNRCIPEESGIILPEAASIKRKTSLPVFCPNVHDPRQAADAVKNGDMDVLALGRPLLADPDWPVKVKNGEEKKIVKCRRDNYCLKRIMTAKRIRCICNPETGYERYNPAYHPVIKSVRS